jgi:hypothetical protein
MDWMDRIFSLYQWLLQPQTIRKEELCSALSDAMKNNATLFKNMFGTISINKLSQNIQKGEMIFNEAIIHLAFAIWQQRRLVFIGISFLFVLWYFVVVISHTLLFKLCLRIIFRFAWFKIDLHGVRSN